MWEKFIRYNVFFVLFFSIIDGYGQILLKDPTWDIRNIQTFALLQWESSQIFDHYTVYFDTIYPPVKIIATDVEQTNFLLENLPWWSNYYWRVEGITDVISIESDVGMFSLPQTIAISTGSDIIKKRNSLIDLIWGNEGFPLNKKPIQVDENINEFRWLYYEGGNISPYCKQINRYTIPMELGFVSYAYHFKPEYPIDEFFIIQQGHNQYLFGDKQRFVVEELLSMGYDVIGLWMPCFGYNFSPILYDTEGELINFGYGSSQSHNSFTLLFESGIMSEGTPLKYFLEPVCVSINYIQEYFRPKHLYMLGLSGGGWTTDVYAAIDERIEMSFPVAGTSPSFLWNVNNGGGDYEQEYPDLNHIANQMERYIMATSGGRKQLLCFNKYDNCCFYGDNHELYRSEIQDYAGSIPKGYFDIFVDNCNVHSISTESFKKIIASINGEKYPQYNDVVRNQKIKLQWPKTGNEYTISIGTNYPPNNIIDNYSLQDTSYLFNPSSEGTYYWVVTSGNATDFPIYKFKVNNQVVLDMPMNGSQTLSSQTISENIKWENDRFNFSNSAVLFDRSFLMVEDALLDLGMNDFSISMWLKFPPQSSYSMIFGKGEYSYPFSGVNILADSPVPGKITFRVNSLNIVSTVGENLNDNTWRHYVFLRKDNELMIYIDGELNSTNSVNRVDVSNHTILTIGANYEAQGAQMFSGCIDELKVFSRCLEDDEIFTLLQNRIVNERPDTIAKFNEMYLSKISFVNYNERTVPFIYKILSPQWLNINSDNGNIIGIPTEVNKNDTIIEIIAYTEKKDSAIYKKNIRFEKTSENENIQFAFQDSPYKSIIDSYTAIRIIRKPDWVDVYNVDNSIIIEGKPDYSNLYYNSIEFEYTDIFGNVFEKKYPIYVFPKIQDLSLQASEGDIYWDMIHLTDDYPKVEILRCPDWICPVFHQGMISLLGFPDSETPHFDTLVVKFIDRNELSWVKEYILKTNHIPRLSEIDLQAREDFVYHATIYYLDEDHLYGDIPVLSVLEKPHWINVSDGGDNIVLNGVPAALDVGISTISIKVTDKLGLSNIRTYHLYVQHTNHDPVFLSKPPINYQMDTLYRYSINFFDIDSELFGDVVSLKIKQIPAWLSFDPIHNQLIGAPITIDDCTDVNVEIQISDGKGGIAEQKYSIRIDDSEAINTIMMYDKIIVSPNPVHDNFTVIYNLFKKSDILFTIFDSKGGQARKINAYNQESGLHVQSVNVSVLTPGMYILQMVIQEHGGNKLQKSTVFIKL